MKCSLCPRKCNVDRAFVRGFCSCGELPRIMRAAPHFGEEPCISGRNGSGAVFFSGCNLKCSFCQNHEISRHEQGSEFDARSLADLFRRLQDSGVHNINLVTGTHFTPLIADALSMAELVIPVIWNSSGYELPETLRMLDGLVNVYLPDYKYCDSQLAAKYSFAPDYPETAAAAVAEMFRQRGVYKLENGMLTSGVLLRHLILPGHIENSMDVIDFAADHYGEGILFSLMSQFVPMPGCDITAKVSPEENSNLIHYMQLRGLNGFYQELSSATEDFIPSFDGTII